MGNPSPSPCPCASSPTSTSASPPFFDGLLPEGFCLEALLKLRKLDRSDSFGQLLCIGSDTVGAVSVEEER